MVDIGVLGPLKGIQNGVSFVPSAPKPRQLLAFLMLNANQTVRAEACITELWGDQPPKSAMSTLQTYVRQIRRVFRAVGDNGACGDILHTRVQGYELTVSPNGFDRAVFEQRSEAGRQAVAAGDDRRASKLYNSALKVWRGPALSDVRAGPLIAAHLVGLNETRRGVLDQRIEADLRLGRHGELLGELRALTLARCTDENTHAQFMLALYRTGKRHLALKVFRRLNRHLNQELGLEPSPKIQYLRSAILKADPVLDLRPVPDQYRPVDTELSR